MADWTRPQSSVSKLAKQMRKMEQTHGQILDEQARVAARMTKMGEDLGKSFADLTSQIQQSRVTPAASGVSQRQHESPSTPSFRRLITYNRTMSRAGKKQKIGSSASKKGSTMTADERKAYSAFTKRKHLGTRFYDQSSMTQLNVHDEILRLFSGSGIQGLLQIHEEIYPSLTSEFLATLVVDTESWGLEFMLGGVRRELSLAQVNTALSLPLGNGPLPMDDNIAERMWYKMTGQDAFHCKDALVNSIYQPIFKIIQKILGNTIYGRAETSKMRLGEVMCLYYMTHGASFDLGLEFVQKLRALASSKSGEICVGGLITKFAKVFDVDLNAIDKERINYRLVDTDHLTKAKIVDRLHRDGFVVRLPDNKTMLFREKILRTTDRRNWFEIPAGRTLRRLDNDSEEESDEEDEEAGARDDDSDEGGELAITGAAYMEVDPSGPFEVPSRRLHDRSSTSHRTSRQGSQSQQIIALSAQTSSMDSRLTSIETQISHLYYHSFGHFYDPNAPFPPPPPSQ